jgi:hypothetical protein
MDDGEASQQACDHQEPRARRIQRIEHGETACASRRYIRMVGRGPMPPSMHEPQSGRRLATSRLLPLALYPHIPTTSPTAQRESLASCEVARHPQNEAAVAAAGAYGEARTWLAVQRGLMESRRYISHTVPPRPSLPAAP